MKARFVTAILGLLITLHVGCCGDSSLNGDEGLGAGSIFKTDNREDEGGWQDSATESGNDTLPNSENAGVAGAHAALQYPVVLHHGLMAGKSLLWPGALKSLSKKSIRVYITEVSAANTVEYRGNQLAKQIDTILADSGAAKVNIIAHSMGGLDARYVISTLGYGDRIASLSTVSTPHHGSPLADMAINNQGLMDREVFKAFVNIIAAASNGSTSVPEADVMAAARDLTTDFLMREFNPANPNDPNVFYQSWTGISGPGTADRIKVVLLPSFNRIKDVAGANDGLVPMSSGQWGEFQGTIAADHLDSSGHKDFAFSRSNFDHNAFLLKVVGTLAAKGF